MTIPTSIRKKAVDYVREGKTQGQAAYLCDISKESVKNFCISEGVSSRITKVSDDKVTAFLECIKNGNTVNYCAKHSQISVSLGHSILKENNINIQFGKLGQNAYRVIALLQNTQLNLAETGIELSISRERVRQIYQAARFNGIKIKER